MKNQGSLCNKLPDSYDTEWIVFIYYLGPYIIEPQYVIQITFLIPDRENENTNVNFYKGT